MTKIILDLDMGIDDALALAYALGSPELELIGITATYGNVLVQDGVRNDLAGRTFRCLWGNRMPWLRMVSKCCPSRNSFTDPTVSGM